MLPGRRPLKSQSLPPVDFPKCFCCLFCCLCCCLHNLLLLVRLVVFVFPVVVAVFFCFCLHCFAFSVFCPAFAAAFGSPTVEKPTLAALDLPKCQEQFYNSLSHHCMTDYCKMLSSISKKKLEKQKFHEKTPVRTQRDRGGPAFWALVPLLLLLLFSLLFVLFVQLLLLFVLLLFVLLFFHVCAALAASFAAFADPFWCFFFSCVAAIWCSFVVCATCFCLCGSCCLC